MQNLKYVVLLLMAMFGNPFYQMISYFICHEYGFGTSTSVNTYQVNLLPFIIILFLIFIIRLFIYAAFFCSKEYPFSVKGGNSFLYIFAERHIYQGIGLITFLLWKSPLEANVIGLIAFPVTLFLGTLISIITFKRLLKIRKIFTLNN